MNYDDSLDAFGVHGMGGTLGAILTGIFAVSTVNPSARIAGVLEGNPRAIVNQLLATIFTWALAACGTFILLKIIQATLGLRVSETEEYDGLDLSQHGESGYNMEDVSIFGAELEERPGSGNVAAASPQF